MSYQVLARKWRPRTFREMAGQEHVLKALINALDHDRLHHAYLFTGTRGVGKTSIARIFAKCLNCEQGVSSEPCGQCSACESIAAGTFVDLIEVDAASKTKVDDTRELLENVQYAPTSGRYKVYLIDEVHMLSASSFNALLKTLEEPPPHVKFLLATTDPQKIPATVLSRCLQFSLKNMSAERVVEHLSHVLDQEMVSYEEPALWLLGRAAQGSMRDALSLTDQAIAFGSGKLSEADVGQMLGTIDQGAVYAILAALAKGEGEALLSTVASLSEHAVDYDSVLTELLNLLHRVSIAQVVPGAVDNSLGDRDKVKEFAGSVAAEDVQFFYQLALQARRDMPLAPDPRSGLEMALLRMLAFRPEGVVAPATQTAARPAEGEPAPAKKPEAPPAADAAATGIAAIRGQLGGESKSPAADAIKETAASSGQAAPESVNTPQAEPAPPQAVPANKPARANPDSAVLSSPPQAPVAAEAPAGRPVNGSTAVASENAPTEKAPPAPAIEKISLNELNEETWCSAFAGFGFAGMLGSIAGHCQFDDLQEQKLQLTLDSGNASLFDQRHSEQIAQKLGDYFGAEIRVELQVGSTVKETPAQWRARHLQERLAAAKQDMLADADVQLLIETFDASLDEASLSLHNP